MAIKKLFEIKNEIFKAVVTQIVDWDDFKVIYYKNGKRLPESTAYYTGDLEDAELTAKFELNRMVNKNEK